MIFANVQRSWSDVLAGRRSAESSVLGDWASLAEAKLHQYADAIAGVAGSEVVAVYDVEGWERVPDDRVRFHGTPSARWAHLIGAPSPVTWTRGQARPVRYVNTAEVTASPLTQPDRAARDRISVRGWTLQVTAQGDAVLQVPAGGRLTVITTVITTAPTSEPAAESTAGASAESSADPATSPEEAR